MFEELFKKLQLNKVTDGSILGSEIDDQIELLKGIPGSYDNICAEAHRLSLKFQ